MKRNPPPHSYTYVLWAVFAFVLWGVFPVYFKILDRVSPWEIVSHRIIWSFLLIGTYITLTRSGQQLKLILADTRSCLLLGLAALLIFTNWGTYVYTILNGYILEISLAYFISPIFTIILGIVFLNEKTTPYKTAAICLCALALLFKVGYEHSLSWYSIVIASTFSAYSMVKKKIYHHSLMAFFIEVAYLFFPTLGYLLYLRGDDSLTFSFTLEPLTFLLIGLGVITSTPLIIFARSVKNVDLSLMGFLQYISPFLTFLLATVVYGEEMNWVSGTVFSLIWVAVGMVSYERVKKRIKK